MRGRTVLVTGASTGLGLAIARRLLAMPARRGRDPDVLVLTARAGSLARFAAEGITASDRVILRALDVTDAAQRHDVVGEIDDRWGGVDVQIGRASCRERV